MIIYQSFSFNLYKNQTLGLSFVEIKIHNFHSGFKDNLR